MKTHYVVGVDDWFYYIDKERFGATLSLTKSVDKAKYFKTIDHANFIVKTCKLIHPESNIRVLKIETVTTISEIEN
jgi:hypothetical protein